MLAFHSHMPSLPRTSLLKTPTQQRSVDTVHTILDAAIQVLEREGTIAFTTNRVAEVAGVSPGTLYQYFASGEMVVAGIVERGVLDAEDLIRSAILSSTDLTIGESVRLALVAVAGTLEPASALLRELVAAAPLLTRHGITAVLEARVMDAIRELLSRDPTRFRVRGGAAALYVGVNGMIYVLLKWLCERPPHVSRDDLIETAVVMIESVVEEAPPLAKRRVSAPRRRVR